MMASTGEYERVGGLRTQRGDSIAVPDEVEDDAASGFAEVSGRAGSAEALKRAARDGVTERWERIEDRSMYGCVDWYLYPDEQRDLYADS
jgi:hypothetical protein